MGDRVAIIGGSTVGRDHFPWAVPDGELDLDEGLPLVVSLESACKWLYLVRRWQVKGTITYAVNGPIPSTYTIRIGDTGNTGLLANQLVLSPGGYEPPLIETGLIGRESGLVLLLGFENLGEGGGTVEGDDGLGNDLFFDTSGFSFMFHIPVATPHPLFYNSGGDFVIPAFISLLATGENEDDGVSISTSPAEAGVGAVACDGPVTIDGEEIALYITGGPDVNTASATCDIVFEPIEYWPYANSNGDPVYDTATGAQLTDPLG